MIRRWSCVINLNNNFNTYKPFFKKFKINVFRNSVNFKKFSFKITKFKRKSLIRFKHMSNFLIYTNIIKFWIKDYLFNKNYLRYQFFNNIFANNFYFYNFNFIKNKNSSFSNNFNFIFFNFTNKNFFYWNKDKINFKNSSIVSAFYILKPSIDESIIPTFSKFDNQLIRFNSESHNDEFNFDKLFDLFVSIILNKNIEIYKIVVLLFYFNNFKKVK